jgi:uncharacterized protein (TIGR02588 family)
MIEWVTAAVSALVILGVAGYLLYDGLTRSAEAPDIRVKIVAIIPQAQGYNVQIEVSNHHDASAASIEIVGQLRASGQTVEESHVTVDYVPAGGSRPAGLYFSSDPRKHLLTVRPAGYELP